MKKRSVALLMSAVMAGSLMTGCGTGKETTQPEKESTGETADKSTEETKEAGDGETVELTIFHYLEQYQDQFKTLVDLYKEVKPNVTLKVECIGADYDKILQTRVSTDEVPDIFLSGPFNMNELYAPVSYNLENEACVENVLIGDEYRAENGELTAIPFMSQGWGILYNKDIFEEAGITELPETLTELEDACKKIQDAGYIPFAQGYGSEYIRNQLFGFPYGVDENYQENIAKLSAKETELKDYDFIHKIFAGAEMVGKYTQESPFDDDFAAAGARLGMGEAAMMVSGDWIVGNAEKANPDCNLGMMGYPLSEDPKDTKVYTAAAGGFHVSKNSEHLEEALEFVNWLATSEEAIGWMSNEAKLLSPIKGVVPADSPVLSDILNYMNENKTGAWGSYVFPSGIDAELIPSIDRFLLGEITKEEAIDEMTEVWKTYEE
ncbi:MAG: carbohydrate ABC transporter substrate-binding protein [Clostridiales bacterium]|nr:carbohydrate ABC transporter substrate-binding protein [Clostridiales bacterium]